MKINLQQIKVRDLVNGYVNNDEEGVVGYGGRLNIRPSFQREFVYNEKQQKAVIDTVVKGYPLNTMYWVHNEDDTFELLDGQQRTLSICEFVEGNFSMEFNKGVEQAFHILNNFDIPVGIQFAEGDTIPDIPSATQWTVATDLKNRRIYYRTMYNSTIRCFDLKKINFTKVKYRWAPLDVEKRQPIVMQ